MIKRRNRAKCRLCETVIESLHDTDLQVCVCGEIGINGGTSSYKCHAISFENFIRIDDDGREIEVKVIEKEDENSDKKNLNSPATSPESRYCDTREEKLDLLTEMIKQFESLPQQAMTLPITHYDFYSLIILLNSILRAS